LKFARLSAKPTAGEESAGLGLYIVKRICDTLKYELELKSVIDKGTTFILKIPIHNE
jgi:signal transduction histidine kinase